MPRSKDEVPQEVQKMEGTRNPPVAVCISCGNYSYTVESINQECSGAPDGKLCDGVFISATNEEDWKDCADCEGTGNLGPKDRQNLATLCVSCQGSGCIYLLEGLV